MKNKYSQILALAVILLSFWSFKPNYDVIIWSDETRRLTFDNFKMKSVENTDTFGISCCGVEYKYQIEDDFAEVTVNAIFIPEKSWIRVKTEKVLNHEQGHFDICEISARRLRKALIYLNKRVKKENFTDSLEKFSIKYKIQHNKNQIVYESSRKSEEKQTYFNNLIQNELNKLSLYKSRTVKIYFKEN